MRRFSKKASLAIHKFKAIIKRINILNQLGIRNIGEKLG
jgi:hypothetical protein